MLAVSASYHQRHPIHETFIREVKAVNDQLPAERKMRVLLGDPPIEWSVIGQRPIDFAKL
jgi:hypothetical protein